MTRTEQLTSWLNSAHAMEVNLAKVLEKHAADAKDLPEMQAQIAEHADETRGHAQRVEECLAVLGEKPSSVKSAMGTAVGMVQGPASEMFHDEFIKNMLAACSSEHFEMACYTSLACAAEDAGQPKIAEICREILMEEVSMADWLERRIEETTARGSATDHGRIYAP